MALKATLTDPSGKVAAEISLPSSILAPQQEETLKFAVPLRNPDRWDTNHPVLYRVKVEAIADGKWPTPIRSRSGFASSTSILRQVSWLNGRNFKVLGVALHSDVGALGMAAPLGAWEHRLAAMKAMGANAIRTAHNPVAPEFLDLCDRMGLLVMDEMFDMWTVAKNPYDYHLYFKDWYLIDTRDTVMRDRNHPSIILWSAGNEIHDTPNAELAKGILGPLVEEFHKNDPTRPVTQALFRPNVSHDYDDGLADLLDVVGQNYRPNEILAAHQQKPRRKIIGRRTRTSGHNGFRCATILLMRGCLCGRAWITWASRGTGRSSAMPAGWTTAPMLPSPMRSNARAGGEQHRWYMWCGEPRRRRCSD